MANITISSSSHSNHFFFSTASYYISCEMLKFYSSIEGREDGILDPDGSGPFKPYKASCEKGNVNGHGIFN